MEVILILFGLICMIYEGIERLIVELGIGPKSYYEQLMERIEEKKKENNKGMEANMNNGVVMGDMNSDFGKKIQAAKEKAEARYQEKVELSKAPDVDVRSYFTDEELERLLEDHSFSGKVVDMSKVQRHEMLSTAAIWLRNHSMEVMDCRIETVSKSRPNAIVVLEMRRLGSLRGQELKVFTAMQSLSDTVFFSGVKDGVIIFTFGIEGIWAD